VDQGLIGVSREARDLRHKTLSLTEDGARVIGAAQREIWPRVAAAVSLCDGGDAGVARPDRGSEAGSTPDRWSTA
jgi:hypothetical protein